MLSLGKKSYQVTASYGVLCYDGHAVMAFAIRKHP